MLILVISAVAAMLTIRTPELSRIEPPGHSNVSSLRDISRPRELPVREAGIRDAFSGRAIADWSAAPARRAGPVSDVLLIHGIFASGRRLERLRRTIETSTNINAEAIDFTQAAETRSNEAAITDQARAISARIKEILNEPHAHTGLALVCHSMGGLAARCYLHRPDLWPTPSDSGVVKLIMLGTPNWGTDVELENPILAVMVARLGGTAAHPNVDRIDSWSPAFKDMFAEWQPAPPKNADGHYRYPDHFRLSSWSRLLDGFISPMPYVEAATAATGVRVSAFDGAHRTDDSVAVQSAVASFFNASLYTRATIHMDYYAKTAARMGALEPAGNAPSAWGITARRISPFLHWLNVETSEPPGIQVYIIAGSENKVPFNVPGTAIQGSIPGPYNQALSDGFVLVDSVLGMEPLTGHSLFTSRVASKILPTNHTDLPDFPQAVDLVLQWLQE